jgi:hypothetical protein
MQFKTACYVEVKHDGFDATLITGLKLNTVLKTKR